MKLTSPAFASGATIPIAYTAAGVDRSPPLEWAELPVGTRALALVVDDPDAPAPRTPWVHWVLANLPPRPAGLPGGVLPEALPRNAVQGRNDWGRLDYGGPNPPSGEHHYRFTLYALDSALSVTQGVSKPELLHVLRGHILDQAVLIGRFARG